MQSHPQIDDAILSSHREQSADAADAEPEQGRHYSDTDITILHSIVAAAQIYIDESPHPKPLPSTALFRAYDELLPRFGISPDSDNHLSTFVFRIGGEQNHDKLFDKFQAILESLGIVLDITNESVRLSASPRVPSASQSPISGHGGQVQSHGAENSVSVNDASSSSDLSQSVGSTNAPLHATTFPERRIENGQRWALPSVHAAESDAVPHEPEQVAVADREQPRILQAAATAAGSHLSSTGQRNALVSAHDRLSRHATSSDTLRPRRMAPQVEQSFKKGFRGANNYGQDDDTVEILPTAVDVAHGMLGQPASKDQTPTLDVDGQFSSPPPQELKRHDLESVAKAGRGQETQDQRHKSDRAPSPTFSQTRILMQRAARARELYLGSKMFSRWADRTAIRLEKEAVARRHMIRFRCFHGWILAPISRTPTAEHLRASAAVQKLRRAVNFQQEQFSLAASAVARAHYSKRAHWAMMRWLCRLTQHRLRIKYETNTALILIDRWIIRTGEDDAAQRKSMVLGVDFKQHKTLCRWRSLAHEAQLSYERAHRLEASRSSLAYLDLWIFNVELQRRSRAFRQCLLLKQASQMFDYWNLRARAQAFRWMCECAAVSRAIDGWAQVVERDALTSKSAYQFYELAAKRRIWKYIKHARGTWHQLGRLHKRARLYLCATRMLDVLGRGAKKRRTRTKNMVRQYLMARYTQSSSRRRRRNCHTALDRWSAAASRAESQSQTASGIREMKDLARWREALADMRYAAETQETLGDRARRHRTHAIVDAWATEAAKDALDGLESWHVWVTAGRRHCLKMWSRGSLQQSGQAHTAAMLQQRHDREMRGRALQLWRRRDLSRKEGWEFEASLGDSGGKFPPSRLSSWRLGHSLAGPMETPTRWTGSAVPLTNASLPWMTRRTMDRVNEADEVDEAPDEAAPMETPWPWQPTTPMSSRLERLGRSASVSAATRLRLNAQRLSNYGQRSVPPRVVERSLGERGGGGGRDLSSKANYQSGSFKTRYREG